MTTRATTSAPTITATHSTTDRSRSSAAVRPRPCVRRRRRVAASLSRVGGGRWCRSRLLNGSGRGCGALARRPASRQVAVRRRRPSACGPSPTRRRSNQRLGGDGAARPGAAVRPLLDGLYGVASDDPGRRGREVEHDARRRRRRAGTRRPLRRSGGGRTRRRATSAPAMRSTRNRRSPSARWQWPSEVQAAVLGLHDVGVDVAARCARRGRRSSSRGAPGDRCSATALRSTSSTSAPPRAEVDVEHLAGVDAEDGGQLGQAPRRAAPPSSAPGSGRGRWPGGEQGDGLVGVRRCGRVEESAKWIHTRSPSLHDVDERVGRVRGDSPTSHITSRSAASCFGREVEALAHLVERRPVVGGDPRHHRQEALHARRRRTDGSRLLQPGDQVVAQLGGLEHLGVLEEREHEGPEGGAVA